MAGSPHPDRRKKFSVGDRVYWGCRPADACWGWVVDVVRIPAESGYHLTLWLDIIFDDAHRQRVHFSECAHDADEYIPF